MPRLTGRSLFACAALIGALLLAIGTACGDDDADPGAGGSAEDYFTELESIFQDADASVTAAEATLESGAGDAATLEEKVALSIDYVASLAQVYRDTIERMDDLEPPDAAASHHDDFVEAIEDTAELSDALTVDLESVETEDELNTALEEFNSEADAALSAADNACQGLQAEADDAGADVDLGCGATTPES